VTPVPMADRPVLVCPAPFGGGLRAPVVAAAIGRALEAAGFVPPELCPVTSGGAGTIEVLLPALGGETGDGFALVEGGGTALVEPADAPEATAERLDAAAAAGPAVIVLAAADAPDGHVEAALAERDGGGRDGARTVVLTAPGAPPPDLPADAVAETGTGFVLDALDIDPRLRAARAVIVGTGRLDQRALRGAVEGEIAVRARQAGVPCHAVVGERDLDLFATRILDLQRIVEAATVQAIEAATGDALASVL
jgi:glycerate 2-kinase